MTKLRIWDKVYKCWAKTEFFCFDKDGKITWINSLQPSPKSMDDFIVEFSTGLIDKNGKEIFEGDMILSNGYILTVENTATDTQENAWAKSCEVNGHIHQ